jgi:hypothetical protein
MQNKLMKIKEYSDGSSSWRVACDCHDPNHDCQLWFERSLEDEPRIQDISLMLSMEVGIYKNYNLLENLWKRITIAAKVLFTGYHTATGEVILDEDGIKALQFALEQGLSRAKAH